MKIGLIGGSGLEDLSFGPFKAILPSVGYPVPISPWGIAKFEAVEMYGHEVYMISRHGKEHDIPPHMINFTGNLMTLKNLDCEMIIATTACGSLNEAMSPGDLVLPDQFIDWTKNRWTSFVQIGEVKHCSMPDPFDEDLRNKMCQAMSDATIHGRHETGTVITIEGPRFSTRAESMLFKNWGADIINMTTASECMLANELQIPFVAVAMVTDWDAWKTDEPPADWEIIKRVMEDNVSNIKEVINQFIKNLNG